MDTRKELREFLISRRGKVTPQQAGLPGYGGHRRVPGLRREEVALLAGVSAEYYTRLERGNAQGVSDTVLDARVRALRLDDAERAHLSGLARASSPGSRARRRLAQQRVRPGVQQLLDAMTDIPAFVQNGRLDVIAPNALARALYADLYDDAAPHAVAGQPPNRLEIALDRMRLAGGVVERARWHAPGSPPGNARGLNRRGTGSAAHKSRTATRAGVR